MRGEEEKMRDEKWIISSLMRCYFGIDVLHPTSSLHLLLSNHQSPSSMSSPDSTCITAFTSIIPSNVERRFVEELVFDPKSNLRVGLCEITKTSERRFIYHSSGPEPRSGCIHPHPFSQFISFNSIKFTSN